MSPIPEEWLKRLVGGKAPNAEEMRRQVRILAFYLGNIFFALNCIFWLGIFDIGPAALLVPLLVYVIGRVAVEGWPPSNPHDLRALARVAERYGVHNYAVVHIAGVAAVVAGLYGIAYFGTYETLASRAAAATIAALVALALTLGHLAIGMLMNFMALRLELTKRGGTDAGLAPGPHTLPDGRHLNIVHNPSETIH